jgi:hypothetical protein
VPLEADAVGDHVVTDGRDPLLALDDYLSGHMPEGEAEAFEEELFESAALAEPAGWLDSVAQLGAYLAHRNAFNPGLTQAEVDASLRSGRRITIVDAHESARVGSFQLPRSAEQIIYRLETDLRGVDQLDVELYVGEHLMKVIRDLEFEPEAGVAYLCCETPLAKLAIRAKATSKVVAHVRGERRTLGVFDAVGEITDD